MEVYSHVNVAEEVNVITVLGYANASKDLREKHAALHNVLQGNVNINFTNKVIRTPP